jgi:vitamin-K-epoxide reductase (warfarin-sensitive)
MIVEQVLLGLAGLAASYYSIYVKNQHAKNPKYKALCDLGPNASCTKVLTSQYGSGFGITSILFGKQSMMNQSNGILGMIFYSLQIFFGLITTSLFSKLALFSSILACLGSLYLAFILAFVLKDLCLVCIATYIINAGLLWSNYQTVYSSR